MDDNQAEISVRHSGVVKAIVALGLGARGRSAESITCCSCSLATLSPASRGDDASFHERCANPLLRVAQSARSTTPGSIFGICILPEMQNFSAVFLVLAH